MGYFLGGFGTGAVCMLLFLIFLADKIREDSFWYQRRNKRK